MGEQLQVSDQLVVNQGEAMGWEPVLSVRPHHVFLEEFMASMLRLGHGLHVANDIPEMLIERHGSSDPYVQDLLGANGSESVTFIEKANAFYAKVRNLDDSNVIEIDIKKDDLCKAAVIGRHCSALNYELNGEARGKIEKEVRSLIMIRDLLSQVGGQEGIDFISQPLSTYPFEDYGGNDLNSGSGYCPVLILFGGIKVKVGTLREALDRVSTNEFGIVMN